MNATLITGASGGIGVALARKLAGRKQNLLLVARTANKLAALCIELTQKFGIQAQYIEADLMKPDAAVAVFSETTICMIGRAAGAVANLTGWLWKVIKRSDFLKSFVVLPDRWVVERSFAWPSFNRRLAKDCEKLTRNSESAMYVAMLSVMLKRLDQSFSDSL